MREYFDIGAFGVNAFTVAEAGKGLVEAHDELSGGAPRGRVYRVAAWEYESAAFTRSAQNGYEGPLAAFRQGLAAYPGNAGVLYDMARVESLEGDKDAALGHLREALTSDPEHVLGWAADDPDLDPLRSEEGFPL